MRVYLSLIGILTCVTCGSNAADWPCWRGPNGLGRSTEKNLPAQWSKDKNIAWKTPLPGKGASSPSVASDRIYVTSQTDDTGLHVIAIDRNHGKILWDKEIAKGKLHANNLHNMATPTVVSDGKLVWALFGTGDLACLDLDGREVWHRNLVKEYGEYHTNHGMGTSPMLFENTLYIACMHQGPSYLLAVDAKTGRNLWKKDRNLPPKDEAQDSYSSPILVPTTSGTQVVLAGAEHINAYQPATGEQIWICGGLKVPHPYGRTISGPTAGEGIVLAVASGFQNRGFTVAIKSGGKGEIAESDRLWTSAKYSPDCPTPLIYEGRAYSIRDDGMASCLNLKSGEPYWQERLFTANVKVSPVAGDGKVYFMSGQGNCAVVKASSKFEILATNELNETTLSTPAISHGQLFIRTDGGLYAVANN